MLYIGMAPMIPKYAFMPNITKLTRCGTDTGTRYSRAIILGYFNIENVSSTCHIQYFMLYVKSVSSTY